MIKLYFQQAYRKVPVAQGVSSTEVGCVLQGVLALH